MSSDTLEYWYGITPETLKSMNKHTNDGGPAFGFASGDMVSLGMTIRDYFAAAALQGILARGQSLSSKRDEVVEAFKYSDAMLKAREAKP